MDFLANISSYPLQVIALILSATLIGFAKTGVQGIGAVAAPLMAIAFGAKESTGVILPMLCFADIIAVIYYRRNAEWKFILRLLPSAIVGFFVALWVDSLIAKESFKLLMAFCIFLGLAIMYLARGGRGEKIAHSRACGLCFGVLGGFTTMIGTAAGPVMSVYLLSANLPKLAFVGTSAWFFLLVNYMKIPLQIFVWDNITKDSILVSALGIPFIFFGAIVGIFLVKKVPEKTFRVLVVLATILATIGMIA